MSDGWFDRSYRSVETPPEKLDARVLAAARRATRRWTLPVIAAGALTIVAVAVLGFLISGHELYVPPDEAPLFDSTVNGDAFRIDVIQTSDEPERLSPPAQLSSPALLREPGGVAPPDYERESEAGEEHGGSPTELDCRRSALVGPLGSPDTRDVIHVCSGNGNLYIEVVWDGQPPCPSRLELPAPSGVPVTLNGRELVVAETRYRCQNGQWVGTDRKPFRDPVAPPLG